jgi:CubicO group peptidase (beta-lactamase class C family)
MSIVTKINDFVIRFSNVNGTKIASANALFRIAAAFFSLLIVSPCFAQVPLSQRIDALFTSYLTSGLAGNVLVVEKDKVTLRKAYGYANNQTKVLNHPETLFNVASIGKLFTVYSILLLEKRGLLSTDDPVSKYVPEFSGSKATIHNLLTHTSGLFNDATTLEYSTRAKFIDSVVKTGSESAPGEKYRYSNAGYSLLAAIVELRSGQPFETFIAQNIFTPLGMRNTGYPWEPRMNKKLFATGYNKNREPVAVQVDFWAARGPGHLVTNVDDLLIWMRALQSPKRVAPEIREKMLLDHLPGKDTYSWNKGKTKHGTRFYHKGGGRSDFESRLMWFPDDGVVIVFMLNNDYDLARKLFADISAIIN